MKAWIYAIAGGLLLFLCGCEYKEVTVETGYKGKARVNPWLAAQRFSEAYADEVKSLSSWSTPDWSDAMCLVPATSLSNEGYTRPLEQWVREGGHLVVLVNYADGSTNDWSLYSNEVKLSDPLLEMLDRSGIELKPFGNVAEAVDRVKFRGAQFEVAEDSTSVVSSNGGKAGYFASVPLESGRITVVTDARIFRNRWIGDKDHAALLKAMIDASRSGSIIFLRGGAVSLWRMLLQYLWPVLIGLGVLVVLWLWKNFSRFGPLEAAEAPSPLRGYDHHLEALGDFQWRLEKAVSLLRPLREQIIERGQHWSLKAGHRDDDFFQWLADRAGLSRDRVARALSETTPSDSAVLIRTTADLQQLSKVLN
ncbi:hypothetical protein JIN85_07180 [Luteolibacter pohnpeiensis]|uniref:DUF4350 domain-containing protein n=1 Tax=Luteolibacter pohnpeiensis TaxID=454153 RepID=A0A934S2Y3_9BACT|nr:DUF4350 domain-containing protein [Luteolibacter pohnpeiensis]MBK1882190.1 hypothetical protein [Luteolibacter pohnpeiensis]